MNDPDELAANLTASSSINDKPALPCVEKYENYEETEKWLLGEFLEFWVSRMLGLLEL